MGLAHIASQVQEAITLDSFSPPLRLVLNRVQAGFQFPATDYIEEGLDLNDHLVHHCAADQQQSASRSRWWQVKAGAQRRVDRRLAPGGSEATVRRKASVSNDLLDRSITTSSKAFSSRGYRPFPQ